MTQLWSATDYPPRNGQDPNQLYSSTHLALPSYSNGDGLNYINNNGSGHYSAVSSPYLPYTPTFLPNQNSPGTMMYMQPSGAVSMPYQMQPPTPNTIPSQQPRSTNHHTYFPSVMPSHRTPHHNVRSPITPEICLEATEEQDSPNIETMRSEPIHPPIEGMPDVNDFDDLMRQYVENLSPKKQDKALIHAKRAANIKIVLIDKKTTSVESAQFRFWVKKMFTLEPKDTSMPTKRKKICHEGKPVAIREKLFKILTRAHKSCSHGGRDKTSAQVRKVYSWVPKELISRFVKLCPTCQSRRGTTRVSSSTTDTGSADCLDAESPEPSSANPPRRYHRSTAAYSNMPSPVEMSQFSSRFRQQNRWMTPMQQHEKQNDRTANLEAAASAMVNMNVTSPMSSGIITPVPSKFAEDPGTPYESSSSSETGTMHQHYHTAGFSSTHGMYDMYRNDHTYRSERVSNFKREPLY